LSRAGTASLAVRLPAAGTAFEEYELRTQSRRELPRDLRFRSRVAYAAAHVVPDPLATEDPIGKPVLDFDATLAYRRHLWSLGFGIAEAMDTAQRGMGLDWATAQELIRLSCAEARAVSGAIACGANTDQLPAGTAAHLDEVTAAYREQCEYIERCGGSAIVMASRALARLARSPEDYVSVYRGVLRGVSRPVILHWLGEAFDPALAGYWGGNTVEESMDACLGIIGEHRDKVDGIKISLLDKEREIQMRRRLPAGVRMYTGDDFHYPELIEGDAESYSDALLGIFDAIAPAAAKAFVELDAGNRSGYRAAIEPTLPLSRRIFEKPTYFYKTGLVFLAYLNGHQSHFRMVGGQESARSVLHLSSVFRLADEAGLLTDPELAVRRMQSFLALAGVC
jgi:hypothetical protein